MKTSKLFFSTTDFLAANSARAFSPIPVPTSNSQANTTALLPVILPAFEFYNLKMGTNVIQLPIGKNTTIQGQFIPHGAIANVRFRYTGAFSKSIGGNINLLEASLESIVIEGQIIQVQSNTPNLGKFADPEKPPFLILSTTARLEVPVETEIIFEVVEVNI